MGGWKPRAATPKRRWCWPKPARPRSAKVAEATQTGELPVVYLLGEKYIEAMRGIAQSQNSKLVVLPADLPAAVRGIMGSLGQGTR